MTFKKSHFQKSLDNAPRDMDSKPEERYIIGIIKYEVSFNNMSFIQTKTTFQILSNFPSSQLQISFSETCHTYQMSYPFHVISISQNVLTQLLVTLTNCSLYVSLAREYVEPSTETAK